MRMKEIFNKKETKELENKQISIFGKETNYVDGNIIGVNKFNEKGEVVKIIYFQFNKNGKLNRVKEFKIDLDRKFDDNENIVKETFYKDDGTIKEI